MASPSPKQKLNFTLTASSPLGRHRTIVDGASLIEVSPRSVVSVSPFNGHEAEFNTAIDNLFDGAYPSATKAFELTPVRTPVYSCQALIVSGFFALTMKFQIHWLQLVICLAK